MKTTFGLLSAVMVAGTVLAQTATNPPALAPSETPTTSAPESITTPTNTPAKKSVAKKRSVKKSVPKKKAPELASVPLVAGPAMVVVSHLNVRGQAKLNSEVVARLVKDQVVNVLEEITLKHSAPDEPSAWAKIGLPSDAHVWVNSSFVDTNKIVTAKKLNLRGGPGENYSVLGLLMRGDEVKTVAAKEDWLEIDAPSNAYAFVAAQYLKQPPAEMPAAAPPTVVATPTEPPPPPPVAEATKLAPPPPVETPVPQPAQPVETPAPPAPTPTSAPAPAVPAPPATTETPAPASVEAPASPRIVQHEGIVRGTVSIQAPSRFELINVENKKTINYLYTPSADLDLRRWKGLHVVVTGQEGLDARWPNTPVLTIQKIEVLDEP